MGIEGSSNRPRWLVPGNVGKLRGKFEEIVKREAEELAKTKKGKQAIPAKFSKITTTDKADELGRIALTSTKKDIAVQSLKSGEGEKVTKGDDLSPKVIRKIAQVRFQPIKVRPDVLKRWPQMISRVESKVESEPDTKLYKIARGLAELNLTIRKRRMNMVSMSEETFCSACQEKGDVLADLFLERTGDLEGQEHIRELQKKLLAMVQGNPKIEKRIQLQIKVAEGLAKSHEKGVLKGSLSEVVSLICRNNGLSAEDIIREARMLGCDEETAKLKMVKRLTVYLQSEMGDASKQTLSLLNRSEVTGFELSVIRGVEKVFKKQVLGSAPSTVAKLGNNFIAIATNKGVIVEEKVAGTGSYKVATFASDFFSVQQPADRARFVTAKAHKVATDFSALIPLKMKVEAEIPLKTTVEDVSEESTPVGSFVDHGEGKSDSDAIKILEGDEASPYSSVIIHEDDESSPYSSVIIHDVQESEEGNDRISSQNLSEEQVITPKEVPKREVPLKELTLVEMKQRVKYIENALADLDETSVEKNRELEKQKSELGELIAKRKRDIAAKVEYKTLSDEEEYLYEIEVTQALQGPGVVKVHSIVDLSSGEKIMIQEAAGWDLPIIPGVRDYETKVVELLDMFKLFDSNQLTLEEGLKMLDMMENGFRAVDRLHRQGYIHKDLKEQNILVTENGLGLLADFGTVAKQQGDSRKMVLTGTPHWMAPEIVNYCDTEKWDNLTEKCDVWSCGMILQSMISGGECETHPALGGESSPYAAMLKLQLLNAEQYEKVYPKPHVVKEPLEHLIWWSTRLDPEERPTMSEFCERFHELKSKEPETSE